MKISQEINLSEYTPIERVREIMGRNLISPLQVEKLLGHHFSPHSKSKYVPFSEEFLMMNSQDRILIKGIPLTAEELYKESLKINPHLYNIFSDSWFIKEKHIIRERIDPVWYFIQKKVNPLSLNKTCEEAEDLLGENEEMPRACEIFYEVLLYYLATHRYLFRGVYPFSLDVFLGNHLLVGFFPEKTDDPPNQLDIRYYANVFKKENIGIISMIKR
ncbi:MAG: hypothetical protein Q7S77_03125 [Candidatus Staskawiczbacteria bacterium]|nr:hypothetical protein [Candidatus Staskawiczbacteria bacterium]